MEQNNLVVLAIGGNSLIKDKDHQRVSDQFEVTRETCEHIARMIQRGWRVVVTHGNGPQVGFILRRSELALHELHPVPLDSCGADTQGAIGYMIQQSLGNEFRKMNIAQKCVTVVTQVLVDKDDPAFKNPTKYIGSFMSEADAKKHAQEEGWAVKEDVGRGWRRVVASPDPEDIIEKDAIMALIDTGMTVVAVGGGGIPVIRDAQGDLKGADAVIDKDLASALLAKTIGADLFMISTGIDRVAVNFKKPNQQYFDSMTLAEAKKYLAEGQFPAGNMGPKIQAVINYLDQGGKKAIVTCPEDIEDALDGKKGTHFIP